MRKIILTIIAVIAILAIAYFIFKPAATVAPIVTVPETATIAEDGTYSTQAGATIGWNGKRPLIEGYMDSGTVTMTEGTATVSNNNIAGAFTFDMNSIAATTTGSGKGAEMLSKHLKSADFFDVEHYPTTQLVINSTTSGSDKHTYTANGELSMKGITKPVSFPITAYSENGNLRLVGTIVLDRTNWGVQYGSDQFFQNLGEKMIDDMFTVAVDLTLTK